jgi:inner membrane protein
MPTVFSHVAVPVAAALGLGRPFISRRLMVAGMAAAIVPDLDVFLFHLGIPYSHDLAHRGFSHSVAFAALAALAAACAFRRLHTTFRCAFLFLFASMASHGVLDAFTTGGPGIAFLWPWSGERYFPPFQVIEVSPISIRRFLSERGVRVLLSELAWIWLPCAALVGAAIGVRRLRNSRRPPQS